MRQLNPSTNLVLAVLAGLGLIGTLSLPWFAAPVTDPTGTDGPVERAAFQVNHFFSADAGTATFSGHDALGSGRLALVVLVVLVALTALAVGTPSLRHHAESVLRLVVLAIPVVLIAVTVAHQGTTTPVHVHYGFLVGLIVAGFMASAAWHGATMREKRKAPVRPRYGTAR